MRTKPDRTIGRFRVRQAAPDDAEPIADLAATIPGAQNVPGIEALESPASVNRLLQTGYLLLVAEHAETVCGAIRWREDEGIAWFDLLLSARPGAGRALVRMVEMQAQDAGLRLVRCRAPEDRVADYLGWLGYLPISREDASGTALLVLERRLPLLTVREQRREDAPFIAETTGRDPYPFEMGARPGWFIVSDGDRPVGLIWVTDTGGGEAEIATPLLFDAYRGRGLEVWMLERAVYHARHSGFHTARVEADQWLLGLRRDLEDHQWWLEGSAFVRNLAATVEEEPGW